MTAKKHGLLGSEILHITRPDFPNPSTDIVADSAAVYTAPAGRKATVTLRMVFTSQNISLLSVSVTASGTDSLIFQMRTTASLLPTCLIDSGILLGAGESLTVTLNYVSGTADDESNVQCTVYGIEEDV